MLALSSNFRSDYQVASSEPQEKSSETKDNSKKSNDRFPIAVKEFSDLDEEEKRAAIWGALFTIGVLVILAYLIWSLFPNKNE